MGKELSYEKRINDLEINLVLRKYFTGFYEKNFEKNFEKNLLEKLYFLGNALRFLPQHSYRQGSCEKKSTAPAQPHATNAVMYTALIST